MSTSSLSELAFACDELRQDHDAWAHQEEEEEDQEEQEEEEKEKGNSLNLIVHNV